ncbi:hypothetical protein E8P82_13445 [Arthrobacter echini]|uniref:Uncharacterized protein n=1 Tax=Arthrobacter echini TaxID=1529066 RepID=A0A4S5E0X8_9MICC|nr:hypothetical protein [Arthrobacter echini]THJ64985.1 hypothetical protein E8P82_13445 [Arthrobacter echini]
MGAGSGALVGLTATVRPGGASTGEEQVVAGAVSYLRSVLLVSLILSVSSASHVFAAGHLPAPGIILLLGVLLLMPAVLLSRRPVSFRSAVLLMGAGQILLHSVFSMTAGRSACQSSAAAPGHHAAFELACSPSGAEPLTSGAVGPMMLLLHGLATVLLALALSRSDQALALLGAWLRPLLVLPAGLPLAPIRREPLLDDMPQTVPPLSVHAAVPTLRGPPRPGALSV